MITLKSILSDLSEARINQIVETSLQAGGKKRGKKSKSSKSKKSRSSKSSRSGNNGGGHGCGWYCGCGW